MDAVAIAGYTALCVLVLSWLVVSFSDPSPRRAMLEWIGATAMYVALLSLFAHGLARALADDSTFLSIAFGFLVTFFGIGLVLCVAQTLASFRGTGGGATNVTH